MSSIYLIFSQSFIVFTSNHFIYSNGQSPGVMNISNYTLGNQLGKLLFQLRHSFTIVGYSYTSSSTNTSLFDVQVLNCGLVLQNITVTVDSQTKLIQHNNTLPVKTSSTPVSQNLSALDTPATYKLIEDSVRLTFLIDKVIYNLVSGQYAHSCLVHGMKLTLNTSRQSLKSLLMIFLVLECLISESIFSIPDWSMV